MIGRVIAREDRPSNRRLDRSETSQRLRVDVHIIVKPRNPQETGISEDVAESGVHGRRQTAIFRQPQMDRASRSACIGVCLSSRLARAVVHDENRDAERDNLRQAAAERCRPIRSDDNGAGIGRTHLHACGQRCASSIAGDVLRERASPRLDDAIGRATILRAEAPCVRHAGRVPYARDAYVRACRGRRSTLVALGERRDSKSTWSRTAASSTSPSGTASTT